MPLQVSSIEKLHKDHAYIHTLIERMRRMCNSRKERTNCDQCLPRQKNMCRSNVEQLIHTFSQVVLKHTLLETLFMEHGVPEAHRLAHNADHLALADLLDDIRTVFSDDGNTLLAIEGLERFRDALNAHELRFDRVLEQHLVAA